MRNELHDHCPVQDIEVVVGWICAMMGAEIKMANLSISGASESACPTGSLDDEVCYSGVIIGFL